MNILTIFLTLITAFCFNCVCAFDRNNVCRNFVDYFDNIDQNPNCWYDRDMDATPEQLAEHYGFSLERHSVRTEDNYVLNTFRLKSLNGLYGKKVIFLQHGLGTDGTSFMLNGNKSFAFLLSKQGYDVWMGNYRGTEFSFHEKYSRNDPEFWNYSLHEHGLYDISANILYVTSKTKRKITFIGHSMGGTGFGIYASLKPNETKNYIEQALLIEPAFYFKTLRGLFQKKFIETVKPLLTVFQNNLNVNVLFGSGVLGKSEFKRFCFESLENGNLCQSLFNHIFGTSKNPITPSAFPIALTALGNLGVKDLIHYCQMIETGSFRMYDYGVEENKIRYNSSIPPEYHLENLPDSTTFIAGEDDDVVTEEDLLRTFKRFRKPNWRFYKMPFNHASWLFNSNADKYFNPMIPKILNKDFDSVNNSQINPIYEA